MNSITLPQTFAEALIIMAKQCAPSESCALLVGVRSKENTIVKNIILTENRDSKPHTRFSIAPEDIIEGYKIAKQSGEKIVGIFHSHPNTEAKPSVTDIRYMTANPVVWSIYSVRDNNMRAYELDKSGSSTEITLIRKP